MWIPEPDMTVEGAGIAAAPAPRRRRTARAGVALGWARARLRTTPGRLALTSVLVVVGVVVFGIVATGAEQSRERAVRAARTSTEPLLVHAANLYTSLSDANATVATGLLGAGGLEPQAARNRYLHDLNVATTALTALTRGASASAGARAALATIADQLPIYTGLIESARANNRQGFPIGAAYLRQAATLLKTSILPAADRLYAIEAEQLNDNYRTATSTATMVALIVAIVVALVPLFLAQRYVTRISRRILNILMLVATVALAAVSVWALIGFISQQNAVATAQHDGSDSLERLSASEVLLSRAQGDLSLTLVNRGTDTIDPGDFNAVMRVLTTPGLAGSLQARFASYQAAAVRVRGLEDGGSLTTAIKQAPPVAAMSDQLGDELTRRIGAAHARFATAARDAASALDGLALAIPLVTVIAAVLAFLGLRQRINEYR
jgi:hypothetical protein